MKCIVCGEEIPDVAKVCSKCQSFQSSWKNHLRFFGALAGLAAILLSATAYDTTTISEWLKEATRIDKVEILDFSRSKKSSFLNSGDGDVFISYVHLSAKNLGWETLIPINRSLRPGEIAITGPTSDISERFSRHRYRTLVGKSTDQFNLYLYSTALWKDCILLDVHLSTGPSFKLLKSTLGDMINTFDAAATLYFRSSKHQKWKEMTFPVIGLVHESVTKKCRSKLNN
ncbi:MAG: zinc ribbon domain-containing protein [Deltaproteobacteria bacterium]|nr:zinc ribbon domain-containing protein [Deltaproteobacteria bacterium]MBW1931325.1 zinc ribbon domain-containing protein [Deltaproteobacteria bacterium]MBW2026916.1 zinc ribbon domain-containing protein [Deltaproteobacteria bacterium]MBW2126994.1 zinc ribbon domain-containing protein [Deltaproteobacteria bacterium]